MDHLEDLGPPTVLAQCTLVEKSFQLSTTRDIGEPLQVPPTLSPFNESEHKFFIYVLIIFFQLNNQKWSHSKI